MIVTRLFAEMLKATTYPIKKLLYKPSSGRHVFVMV
jgi:hypothetical protein